jgi:hypothetical protein
LLAWDAHALAHGSGFFVSNALNAPYGVNLMWNTSMLLPGTLFAPVTWLWGPIAAFNVLFVLGFAGSALVMYFVLGRWVSSSFARFAGGLLYGFSPFAQGHGLGGHLNFVMGWFPPIILLAADEMLVRQRWTSRRAGITFGLAVTAQLFISEEVVSECAVLLVVAIVVLFVRFRHEFRLHLRHASQALAWSAVPLILLCSVPLYVQLTGPDHIHGPVQPYSSLDFFSADLLGPVIPSGNQKFVPSSVEHLSNTFVGDYGPESTAYVGIPLLALIIVGSIVLRRKRTLSTFAFLFWAALILSLGPRLIVGGHNTGFPLPFAVLRHVPLFTSEISARYAQFVALFGAVILSMTLDAVAATTSRRLRGAHRRSGGSTILGQLGVVTVSAVCLVPLLPNWPYPMIPNNVPAFFTGRGATSIPPNSTVLAYPFPLYDTAQIMLWQAYADFRFRLVGGYAVMPGAHGNGTLIPRSSVIQTTLVDFNDASVPTPVVTVRILKTLDRELCADRVESFIVDSQATRAADVAKVFTRVTGSNPVDHQGYLVWSRVSTCRST